MYNVSQTYLDALASKAVTEAITGTLFLPESSDIVINDSVLVSGSLKLTKELCGEKYRIGTFNLSCLKFSFFSDSAASIDLTGGSVTLSYTLAAAGEEPETVPLGTFLVDPILSSRRKDIINIIAYDVGVKADKEPSYTLRNMTGTPAQLIIAACDECGINTDIEADSLDGFPNSSITVSPKDRQIQSCRDIIMWCAYLLCGYAVIDRNSKLCIISAKYSVASGGSTIITDREVTAAERRYINATDTRAYIKYMSAYKDNDIINYTSTYVSSDEQAAPAAYALDKNPLLAGKTAAEYDTANRAWLAYIDSFKQRGIKTCIYGDPAIDVGDTLLFSGGDIDQRSGIIGVVTSYEWIYREGHVIYCSAADCVGSLVGNSTLSSTQTKLQTEKRIDAMSGTGQGGVGENVGRHNERFNGYTAADGCTIIGASEHDYNHAEGYKNKLQACQKMHVCGSENEITGANNSFVFGENNYVTGSANGHFILGGYQNKAYAPISQSAVFGDYNTITSVFADGILQGGSNQINTHCDYCVVAGNDIIVNHTTGSGAGGMQVFGESHTVEDSSKAQHAMIIGIGANTGDLPSGANARFLVGGSGNHQHSSNVFYIDAYGNCHAAGNYNTMGADYAEYFEWADGNPDNEDRRGLLVALDGDKIVPANGNGFFGVISSAPSVVGNSASLTWRGKFRRDVFGDIIRDEKGSPIINPDFDESMEYIPRSKRPEWAPVGLVGRLIVIDDGSCTQGGYCTAKNGIAAGSKSPTRARMLRRTDDTHIEVLVK